VSIYASSPDAIKAMTEMTLFQKGIDASGMELSLVGMIRLRASQISNCSYCKFLQTSSARAKGESEQRIVSVISWRFWPFFTPRERAALEWLEALAELANTSDLEDVFARVSLQFTNTEIYDLTLLINNINSWNRLAKLFD
jgi:AhpD family alkylhydroperoxidase